MGVFGRLINSAPKWLFMLIWFGLNVMLFVLAFIKYNNAKSYYYLRQLVGLAIPVARASAAVLNFNCMLILLPVCRNLISLLRGSCKCCPKVFLRLMDHNLEFHKACAYMICLNTIIHYGAHTFDFERFETSHENTGLKAALSNITTDDGLWLNPIRSRNERSFPLNTCLLEVMSTIAGVSGIIITLSLIIIYSSATEVIRRSYFEVFWYTHHLFIIFFIGLFIHGIGGVVRTQSNLDENDPEICAEKYQDWGIGKECEFPKFARGKPATWMWILFPVFLYMVERFIRFTKSFQRVVIIKVVKHKSRVLEIQMRKRDFTMQSGQYIFLHCPQISRLEWHPFTLTSAPDQDFFSVHIRTVGDWTNSLLKLCTDGNKIREHDQLPGLSVDGPFGTATEDVYKYDVDVLIAAGIGVTPFASVLSDIWFKMKDPLYNTKLSKIHFYWLCPDRDAFDWFNELLKRLEREMGGTNFLQYNLYLTRGWTDEEAAQIAENEDQIYCAVTNLRQKTFFGRPNWKKEFTSIAQEHKGRNVGVFFCGPSVLANTLGEMCNKHSSDTNFVFNKENF